jgi:PAS domain S-box-containing protein
MDGPPPLDILVVEDDADTRANLRDILELDGHRIELAGTAAEALSRDDWPRFSAIILDRRLPDSTAEGLLPKLRAAAPAAAAIVVTGFVDLRGAIAALRLGAADYILKPIDPAELRARLGRIAERRRAEEGLRRAEERFRLLVQNSSDIITTLASDGSVLYQSPSIEHLLGYRPEDRVGRNILRAPIVHPDDLAKKRAFLDDALRRPGVPVAAEFRLRHADGTWRHFEAVGQNLLSDPSVGAIIANYRDITERKRAEERALQAQRLAAIGEMVAGLAHESRNALQRSQACLEMLALIDRDRPQSLDLIARIQKAQDHLHHLFEDVRGYAAPIHLERQSSDLRELWRESWAHLEPDRRDRPATLREEVACDDLRCSADPFRLRQVFGNILENALAAGAREVVIRGEDAHLDGQPALRVVVHDDGPGLDAEQRRRAFDPFYTTKAKGTGLGMAIARRIVEAHGGQIAIGDGPGAAFILTLPRGTP